MSVPLIRRSGPAFIVICQVLALTACGSQPYWDRVNAATVSSDGLTLTAELEVGAPPEADGTDCYQVVDKEVIESSSQVIIGIQMRDNCASIFPWDRENSKQVSYSFNVDLKLHTPLAGRPVLNKEDKEPVVIKRPVGGS
ncbi:hypothetical protein AB0M95_38990 [Sphaerisporangium sp. NPDC051017]|uniref:hypothetical protein n=1 Tax=Sphaerisporangium sp. NPDC051017 TaxID=3154636 RepID=UPI00343D0045